MTQDETRSEDELSRRLAAWRVPDTPARLEARLMASYRSGRWKRGFWRSLLTTSVRVPLPVAAGVALLCVVSLLLAARPARPGPVGPTVNAPYGVDPADRPADELPERDLSGFEPMKEMKVTILHRGSVR